MIAAIKARRNDHFLWSLSYLMQVSWPPHLLISGCSSAQSGQGGHNTPLRVFRKLAHGCWSRATIWQSLAQYGQVVAPFSFCSCQKERQKCVRNTVLRCQTICWWRDMLVDIGCPLPPAPAMLLHYERGGNLVPYCCSSSPHYLMLFPWPCSALAT